MPASGPHWETVPEKSRANASSASRDSAPIMRSVAALPAADESTQRRQALGRRMHAQLAAVLAQRFVEHAEADAGLGPHRMTALPEDPVEAEHLDHCAASKRHRLAEVARPRAPRNDWDA